MGEQKAQTAENRLIAARMLSNNTGARRFQRDIAGETVSDHHIDGAQSDVIAFDKAMEGEIAAAEPAQHGRRRVLVMALLLLADVQETDAGMATPPTTAAKIAPISAIGSNSSVALDIGANKVKHAATPDRVGRRVNMPAD